MAVWAGVSFDFVVVVLQLLGVEAAEGILSSSGVGGGGRVGGGGEEGGSLDSTFGKEPGNVLAGLPFMVPCN